MQINQDCSNLLYTAYFIAGKHLSNNTITCNTDPWLSLKEAAGENAVGVGVRAVQEERLHAIHTY